MSETPKSARSKSLTRSAKSVSFSESSEFIPAQYHEGSVPEIPERFRQHPVPYYHAPDDFHGERCCELWPNCGEAMSALSYSEKGDSDNEEFPDDEFRGRSRESAYFRDASLDEPLGSTRHSSLEIVPLESRPSLDALNDRRLRFRSGYSEKTLVDNRNESTDELRRDRFDDSLTIYSSRAPSMTKGSLVGEEDDVDLEKQIYLPTISVTSPPPNINPYLVKFVHPKDSLNPKNWPSKKRWRMTFCVASFTFLAPLNSSMIAPSLPDIARDFHITNDIQIQMVLSIFVLAFAVGPVVFGPLSELYGRVNVLQCANLLFLTFTIACGFAQSEAQIMAFRFLAGLGGSAPLAIGGGVLGDLFMPEERGKAMALYGIGPLLGPSIGPLLGSFVAAYSTWRWMFWAASIASACILTLSFVFLEECYAPLLLQRKATRLRESSGIDFYRSEHEDPNRTVLKSIATALTRALKMLFTQPLVQVLALYMAYAYGTMYLVLATFPTLWTDTYHESTAVAGLNYISLGLGFFLGAPIVGKSTDKIYKHLTAKHAKALSKPKPTPPPPGQPCPTCGCTVPAPAVSIPPSAKATTQPRKPTANPPSGPPHNRPAGPPTRGKPEYRLPLLLPFSLLPPIGLLIYGWTSSYHLHWILPNIGAFIFSLGTVAAFQCITSYLIDAYTKYAASAIAAVTVLRSLAGFGFPMFAGRMYGALGLGWGNTVLAGVALGVGVPVTVGLVVFGETLRKRSGLAVG